MFEAKEDELDITVEGDVRTAAVKGKEKLLKSTHGQLGTGEDPEKMSFFGFS